MRMPKMGCRIVEYDAMVCHIFVFILTWVAGPLLSPGNEPTPSHPPQPPAQRLHIPRMRRTEFLQHRSILGIPFQILQMQ